MFLVVCWIDIFLNVRLIQLKSHKIRMSDEHLKWLRGPLPPLSESIVSSGLINESALQSTVSQTQQQVFGSSPMTVPSKKKKGVKRERKQNLN